MPGKMEKVDGWRVTWGGKTTAKETSKSKAEGQLRVLRMKEHGITPKGGWRDGPRRGGKARHQVTRRG